MPELLVMGPKVLPDIFFRLRPFFGSDPLAFALRAVQLAQPNNRPENAQAADYDAPRNPAFFPASHLDLLPSSVAMSVTRCIQRPNPTEGTD